MSYMQFQQRCEACGETWNAAFGIVGMKIIAQPPKVCPVCKSPRIEHHAHGWKMNPQPKPDTGETT